MTTRTRRSPRFLYYVVAVLLCVAPLARSSAAEAKYAIETTKTKTIKGTYTFEIDAPKLKASEWIVFVAAAPNLPCQSNTSTRLFPGGLPYTELSPRARSLLRARVPATDDSLKRAFHGRIEVQATLYARKIVERKPGGKYAQPEALSSAERQFSLAETAMLDFSADKFKAWMKQQQLARRSNENDLDYGRRTFLAITRSCSYEYREEMDRHASHVCQAGKSDCGGLSGLFVATLRASGVPARMLFGRWAKSAEAGSTVEGVAYYQQHVKAEFHAQGIGWVPVDLSSAVLHDKSSEGLRYFGNDRGDFLVAHVDPDLTVDTVHFGQKTFGLLQSFRYYVTGSGSLDPTITKLGWKVE